MFSLCTAKKTKSRLFHKLEAILQFCGKNVEPAKPHRNHTGGGAAEYGGGKCNLASFVSFPVNL